MTKMMSRKEMIEMICRILSRSRQRHKETLTDRQRQPKTDMNRHSQKEIDRDRQGQTETKTDAHTDTQTKTRTHLLRTAFRIVDMEWIMHAKNQQNQHDETYEYICIITGVNDNIKQQRYTICPPQLRLICAQGRDYIYIYIILCRYRFMRP